MPLDFSSYLSSGYGTSVLSGGDIASEFQRRLAAETPEQLTSWESLLHPEGRSRGPVEWLGDTLGIVGSAVARGVDLAGDVVEGDFSLDEVLRHAKGLGRSALGIVGLGGNPEDFQYYFGDVLAERGYTGGWATGVGLGLDIALDPTTYLTAGGSAGYKAAARGTSALSRLGKAEDALRAAETFGEVLRARGFAGDELLRADARIAEAAAEREAARAAHPLTAARGRADDALAELEKAREAHSAWKIREAPVETRLVDAQNELMAAQGRVLREVNPDTATRLGAAQRELASAEEALAAWKAGEVPIEEVESAYQRAMRELDTARAENPVLADTLPERIRAGQSGFRLELPFTDIGTDLILPDWQAYAAEKLGRAGQAIGRFTGISSPTVRGMFSLTPVQQSARAPARLAEGHISAATSDAVIGWQRQVEELGTVAGRTYQDVNKALLDAVYAGRTADWVDELPAAQRAAWESLVDDMHVYGRESLTDVHAAGATVRGVLESGHWQDAIGTIATSEARAYMEARVLDAGEIEALLGSDMLRGQAGAEARAAAQRLGPDVTPRALLLAVGEKHQATLRQALREVQDTWLRRVVNGTEQAGGAVGDVAQTAEGALRQLRAAKAAEDELRAGVEIARTAREALAAEAADPSIAAAARAKHQARYAAQTKHGRATVFRTPGQQILDTGRRLTRSDLAELVSRLPQEQLKIKVGDAIGRVQKILDRQGFVTPYQLSRKMFGSVRKYMFKTIDEMHAEWLARYGDEGSDVSTALAEAERATRAARERARALGARVDDAGSAIGLDLFGANERLAEATGGKVGKFFETDLGVIRYAAGMKGQVALTQTEWLLHAFDEFGTRVGVGVKPARGSIGADRIIRQAGIALPQSVADGLKQIHLDRGTADEIVKAFRQMNSPEVVTGLGRLVDKATSEFKAAVLGGHPAYHFQNFSWNKFAAGILHGVNPIGAEARQSASILSRDAAKLSRRGLKSRTGWIGELYDRIAKVKHEAVDATPDYIRGGAKADDGAGSIAAPLYGGAISEERLLLEARKRGVISREVQMTEDPTKAGARTAEGAPTKLWEQKGDFRSYAHTPKELGAAGARLVKRGFWDKLFGRENPLYQLGSAIENHDRLTLFIKKLGEGLDFDAAAKTVDDTFFDYGATTRFRRKLGRFIPFQSWLINSGPLMLRMMVEQPGLMSALAKTRSRLGDPTAPGPDYLREQSPIDIFGYKLGSTRDPSEEIGKRLAAIADPFRAALSVMWPETFGRDGEPIYWSGSFGSLSPFLQYPLELMSGHDARGFKIDRDKVLDGHLFLQAILPGQYVDEEGRKRADWRMMHFLSKIPGSRWLSSFDKALREDKGNAEKVAGLLLGLNLTDPDEQAFAEGLRADLLREFKRQQKADGPLYNMLRQYAIHGRGGRGTQK